MTEKDLLETQPDQPPLAEEEAVAEAPEPGPEQLAEQLAISLKAKEDQYLRVCAEYDNFRKRSQKEREGLFSAALADIVASFIPVVDNMERACAAEDAGDGVRMILKQLCGVLEKYGVTAVGQPGEPFDPNLHSAVAHEGEGGSDQSLIIEVLQKGYILGGRLIRPAMVRTQS